MVGKYHVIYQLTSQDGNAVTLDTFRQALDGTVRRLTGRMVSSMFPAQRGHGSHAPRSRNGAFKSLVMRR